MHEDRIGGSMSIEDVVEELYKKAYNEGYRAGVVDAAMKLKGITNSDIKAYNKAREITDKMFADAGLL